VSNLSFGGISVQDSDDGREAYLYLWTPSGQIRKIPLDERELRKIVAEGARYLQILAGDRP
jgi:hypothetical protein